MQLLTSTALPSSRPYTHPASHPNTNPPTSADGHHRASWEHIKQLEQFRAKKDKSSQDQLEATKRQLGAAVRNNKKMRAGRGSAEKKKIVDMLCPQNTLTGDP